ncbi:AsmA family protein [Vibrio sp. SCSIO 43136]|uniref:AsmA family protein n=1 Tax=Vibrio sp. SCSIO 43136 TaxID=2819101 RepID=UPI002074E8CF|nr:AsmA family protein [Vibrio sp. SCSIO 43136]USD64424.1 AsmA family protein [Vibrio sp. SCSIO 43136]
MKKLLWIVGSLFALVLVAIVALVLFINPNQFKPLIVDQAKQQTGLELVIDGDIGWQFFPTLGFNLGQTQLKNPQGFSSENMLSVEQVALSVEVSPLFDQQLVIGEVILDGAQFALETRKDGTSNLDALTQAQAEQPSEPAQTAQQSPQQESSSETSSSSDAWSISLAGIKVSNAKLSVLDNQAGSETTLYDMNFTLSEFAFEKWAAAQFDTKGKLTSQGATQQFSAQGKAEFKLLAALSGYELRNVEFDATYQDATNTIEKAKVALASLNFDAPNQLEFELNGVVSDLTLQAKASTQLTIDKAFSLAKLTDLVLDANLQGDALPQSPMKVDMASALSFDLTKQHLAFNLEKLTANRLEFDGKADVTLGDIPKVRFNLHSPNIDLDEFLGLNQSSTQTASTNEPSQGGETQTAPVAEVEPDLSALKGLDVKGAIVIDKFKAANAKVAAVTTEFSVNRGVATLNKFSASLYEGTIAASGKLDARKSPATYSVKKKIKGVQVHPLLVDVAEFDMVDGTGNIDVDVKGQSLKPTELKKNLAGKVVINFADGAVHGVNVAQVLRNGYARVTGQPVEESQEAKKTDFSAMSATMNLSKGVMKTNDLKLESPLLRISGSGQANYVAETVDMLIRTSVVGSLEGQGGKSIDDLKDLTIPVQISGSWAAPEFKPVFDDILKQKAKQEAERGLKRVIGDKLGNDEKTKEIADQLLKGLFN